MTSAPIPSSAPNVADARGIYLSELTWLEARNRFEAGAVALIPVGAGAKEHGPHLPLDTDARVAQRLVAGVMAQLPVVVTPTLTYGYYPAFRHWPGSTHLSAATFQAMVTEVAESLARHGVTRQAILNTGVSTEAPLQLVARHMREAHGVKLAVADIRSLGRRADGSLEQASGGHADERETSLMLEIAPETVRFDLAPEAVDRPAAPANPFHWPVTLRRQVPADDAFGPHDLSGSGATGAPRLATVAKGEAILDAMVADLVDGLRMTFPDAFDPAGA
jgi:creatinine amidohydrolase